MLFTSKNDDNVVAVVFRMITYYGVKITRKSVTEYLKPHPDYPSLKSVCNLFENFNVRNYPLRIDENELFSMKDPFIAHLNSGQGLLVLIYKINRDSVLYADSLKTRKSMKTKDFLEKWSRAVILIDPDHDSFENDYNDKVANSFIRDALIPFLIAVFCLTIIYGIFENVSLNEQLKGYIFPLLIITKSAGLFFSIFLFIHELDFRTKFADKLCHISTHADCDAVTKSRASKIFANITWADAGVTYFLTGLILIFIVPNSTISGIFPVLAALSLPYPIFSILYQWLKIKKWCPLCISVQTILVAEFVILANSFKLIYLTAGLIFSTIIILSVVFSIHLLVKLLYISEKEKDNAKLDLQRLKRNPKVFLSQININEKIIISQNAQPLILGDKNAKVVIEVFLSFYCSACSEKFKEILKLIDSNTKVKVQLIFSPTNDENTIKLTKFILQKNKTQDSKEIISALRSWYEDDTKVKHHYFKDSKFEIDENEIDEFNKNSSVLFSKWKITQVPTLFINGYPYPESFKLEDIKYHLDSIVQFENSTRESKVII